MRRDFSTRFTAGAFLAAAGLWWVGWMLLPVKIGTYFEPGDFAAVHETFHFWIWMYRVHIFGIVVTAIALVALASLTAGSEARVMIWPGATVATAGAIVGAVGAAFYYHHGAWGALETQDYSAAQLDEFVAALRVDTEWVTCLVRFGRVFGGLGLLVLAGGLIKWRIVPAWLGWAAVIIGLAAMALTMLLPDHMDLYQPVFHVNVAWLAAAGVVILRHGVNLSGDIAAPGEPAAKQ